MLVLDIDGTIYRKDFTASSKVKDCIKSLVKKGLKVVIATGRMYSSALQVAKEFNLDTPIICYQGGLIKEFNGSDKTLYQKTVDSEFAREIIELLKTRNIHCNVYINDELIVENDSDEIRNYTNERNISYKVVSNFHDLALSGINKILAIDTDVLKIERLTDELGKKYKEKLYIVRSTPIFCEISNLEATKGSAVRFLANFWKIGENEIMAVGDQDNDIEMLLAAGVKVAMGNATGSLKEIADFVTDSVDNDGVCSAVAKFIY